VFRLGEGQGSIPVGQRVCSGTERRVETLLGWVIQKGGDGFGRFFIGLYPVDWTLDTRFAWFVRPDFGLAGW
jgi:hypothetical protein